MDQNLKEVFLHNCDFAKISKHKHVSVENVKKYQYVMYIMILYNVPILHFVEDTYYTMNNINKCWIFVCTINLGKMYFTLWSRYPTLV